MPAAGSNTKMQLVDLAPETTRRVDALFSGAMRHVVIDLLVMQCGANLPLIKNATPSGLERIRFAVLKLSGGDFVALVKAVEIAQIDWRHVLVAAGFATDVHAHKSWFPEPGVT